MRLISDEQGLESPGVPLAYRLEELVVGCAADVTPGWNIRSHY
jgi:hypothetical protein